MLFCAAQAPELFGRDQRYGVLPLYFSRVLTRSDYALAKVFGLIAVVPGVVLAPYVVLFVGRVFVARTRSRARDEIDARAAVRRPGAARGGLLGGSRASSRVDARRAYATAAIIAVFIIPPIIVAILGSGGVGSNRTSRGSLVCSARRHPRRTNAAIFGRSRTARPSPRSTARLVVRRARRRRRVGSIGLTVRRYRGSRMTSDAAAAPRPAARPPPRRQAAGARCRTPRSPSSTSRAGTATSSRSTTSRSRWAPVSPACSGRTAPASRRSCT
jgi:hypothetical protein